MQGPGSRVQCPWSQSSRDSCLGSSGGSNRNPSGRGLQWDFGHVSDCTLSPVPTHLGGLVHQPSSQLVRSNGLIFKSTRVSVCYLQIRTHVETNLDQAGLQEGERKHTFSEHLLAPTS